MQEEEEFKVVSMSTAKSNVPRDQGNESERSEFRTHKLQILNPPLNGWSNNKFSNVESTSEESVPVPREGATYSSGTRKFQMLAPPLDGWKNNKFNDAENTREGLLTRAHETHKYQMLTPPLDGWKNKFNDAESKREGVLTHAHETRKYQMLTPPLNEWKNNKFNDAESAREGVLTHARGPSSIEDQENGRDRLKRHRVDVAGQVWIPDMWGQEDLLKDWIDCSAFDASLMNSNIISARAALVEEGRRATTTSCRLGIENSC